LHLLAKKQGFLRVRQAQRMETLEVVSTSILRKAFNTRTGLDDKSRSFQTRFIKSCLNAICSSKNSIFPGGWIVANRNINGVKSDNGLIFKLGYVERAPYTHKLFSVIQTNTNVDPKGVLKLHDQSGSEYNRYSFLEFRSGAALVAPRLDHRSSETLESQMKTDPLSIRNESTLTTYGRIEYHKSLNALNTAHALLVSCKKGKSSKTRPIHYEIARNEFLHSTAKVPIVDGRGAEASSLSGLAKPVYEFCRKTFRFDPKSKRESEGVESSKVDVDMSDPAPTSSDKKQKVEKAFRPAQRGRGGLRGGGGGRPTDPEWMGKPIPPEKLW
jgi:hypothetical protein